MRITICISSLGQGGAERIASIMATHWAGHGNHVGIVTFSPEDVRPVYPLDSRVEVRNLGLRGQSRGLKDKLLGNLGRIRALRRALRAQRPDVVISFMDTTNVLTLLAAGSRVPVIVTEHCHPEQFPVGAAWGWLRRRTYPRAAAVVVLGEAIRQWFAANVGGRRLEIIQNPVTLSCARPSSESRPGTTVISAGRLAEEKRFGLLIEAFSRVGAAHPDWELAIYGEGPERPMLEALVAEKGLGNRVSLPGWVDDLHARMASADIFALSSRSEAFPGALCEAMASGLAVVSVDCPSGPGEIIRQGVDGLLVPNGDVAALAAGLDRLMGDAPLRQSLGGRAVEVCERFSIGAIMDKWERLIRQCLPSGAGGAHGRRG